jgi:very-short-patch-repair endonuclease
VLPQIDAALERAGGVASRDVLLTAVSRHQLDHEIRRGDLIARFRGVYCRPWDADRLTEQAALVSLGPDAVVSHLSALRLWRLLDPATGADQDVHVSLPARRCPRQPGLRVHRVANPPPSGPTGRLRVVTPAEAVVTSWPLLPRRDQRAPAITAVRQRLAKPDQLRQRIAAHRRLPGRKDSSELVSLLAAGCESELEIWGLLEVFDVPGLRHGERQLLVRTPAGTFRVDLGYEAERVAFELDGGRYHSARANRERDLRRDAAMAGIDWLTVRYSWERMHDDIPGCRRDALAILAARRR